MRELIQKLERDFFSAAFCGDRANLERRLAKGFLEYGKSGAIHDRESTIGALLGLRDDRRIEIEGFEVYALGEGAVLALYVSRDVEGGSRALRSSVWVLEDGEWRIRFHQGTKISRSQSRGDVGIAPTQTAPPITPGSP